MAKNVTSQTIPIYGAPNLGLKPKTDPYRFSRTTFFEAGQDSFTQPPAQDPDLLQTATNVLPPLEGILRPRWGTQSFNEAGTYDGRLEDYQNVTTNKRLIIDIPFTNAAVRALNEDGSVWNGTVFTVATGAVGYVHGVASRDYHYFLQPGDYHRKWDGGAATTTTLWGIVAPVSPLAIGATGAGAITLVVGRQYFVVFKNSLTGHISDLSPISLTTGPLAANNQALSGIPVSLDTQVDSRILLATADGGDQTVLYFLTSIADNTTTTYTDNTDEATLLASNVYQETDASGNEFGVADNTPPPLLSAASGPQSFPTKHGGRLFIANGQYIYYSKNLSELTTSTGTITGKYEESFPAANVIDVSGSAETITGLFSDGQSLWIGTNRHIRRIIGDDPTTFGTTEIVFANVGVGSNETWQAVFKEGQPIGAMWLTPDKRVIFTDFNTYMDIGTPIQDVLTSINSAYLTKASAAFFSLGPHSVYALAIPTGVQTASDTILVHCLRSRRWFKWLPGNPGYVSFLLGHSVVAGVMLPLLKLPTGPIHVYDQTYHKDFVAVGQAVNITATAVTSWLELGDATILKALNELDITFDGTANLSALNLIVYGANGDTTYPFSSPVAVTANIPTIGPGTLGMVKLYLAGFRTFYRYYQFSFSWTAASGGLMRGFNVEVAPISRM